MWKTDHRNINLSFEYCLQHILLSSEKYKDNYEQSCNKKEYSAYLPTLTYKSRSVDGKQGFFLIVAS